MVHRQSSVIPAFVGHMVALPCSDLACDMAVAAILLGVGVSPRSASDASSAHGRSPTFLKCSKHLVPVFGGQRRV